MKCLQRNKRGFYYALYEGETEIKDENGDSTGQYTPKYVSPVLMRASISPAKGKSVQEAYGIASNYTHIIITDDLNTPIENTTVFWIGVSTNDPPNFRAVRVSKGLTNVVIEIKEVDID